MDNRTICLDIFYAALKAVGSKDIIRKQVRLSKDFLLLGHVKKDLRKIGKIYALGVGKASGAMVYELQCILGNRLKEALIVAKTGHLEEFALEDTVRVIEASHPIPDQNSVKAAQESLAFLKRLKSEDLLIFLLSGGASSLWCDVPEALTLSDIQALNQALVLSEASIAEINAVRKHFSYLKGGQMLKYCPDNTVSLIISDVPGDDLSVIGSGPTSSDSSTFQDVLNIFRKYDLEHQLTEGVIDYLRKGLNGIHKETLKRNDRLFNKVQNVIIASNKLAIAGAAKKAYSLGYNVYIEKNTIIGNTEVAATEFTNSVFSGNWKLPFCLIQGGETVIKVNGTGKGGRNMHFALKALQTLHLRHKTLMKENFLDCGLLSCGTDGSDGPTDATGAVFTSELLEVILKGDIDIDTYLNENDSYLFFENFGGLVETGPTQTNVMDIQLLIVN